MRWIEAAAALGMAAGAAGLAQNPTPRRRRRWCRCRRARECRGSARRWCRRQCRRRRSWWWWMRRMAGSDTGAQAGRRSSGERHDAGDGGAAAIDAACARDRGGDDAARGRESDAGGSRADGESRAGSGVPDDSCDGDGERGASVYFVAEPDGEFAVFAVADGAVGVCDAEFEAGVGDRFGAGACGDSGEPGAGVGGADGQRDVS